MANALLNNYVNFPDGRSARIVNCFGGQYQVVYNWQELDLWAEAIRADKRAVSLYLCPPFKWEFFTGDEIRDLVSDTPKYLLDGVALSEKHSIIQPTQRNSPPRNFSQSAAAMSPIASSTPLRKGSGSSQEIEIMAKCAVFDSENVLVKVYDSKKEAKAHNKGTDLQFIDAKNFPEGGIGEYATVEDLFPPKEASETEGEETKRTRTVVKYEGKYTVLKADNARLAEDDERAKLHSALVSNDNVEDYLAAAPEVANFTSSRGATQKVSATGYLAYAVKRGWVVMGDAPVAEEVVVEEE